MRPAARCLTLALAVLLLFQPVLPAALAHGGQKEGHHTSQPGGQGMDPNASAITPNARYVRQQSPAAHGSLVVWEQRSFGRDWDIMAYNFSSGGDPFPLTTRAVNERDPAVRGPWVAWEEHHPEANASTDIVVFDVRTGHVLRVPDSGHDEVEPVFGGGSTLYYVLNGEAENRYLRAFDLDARTVEAPIGNRTIVGDVGAYKRWVTWAEGRDTSAKIHVLDRASGEITKVPRVWTLSDGPTMGPVGVAFIARHTGTQRGTYTTIYNLTTRFNDLRSGVYPHENLAQCDAGVVWNQPGTATSDADAVALWDRYIETRIAFTANNTDPTCTREKLIYVKRVPHEDPDIDHVRRIYALDLSNARLPIEAEIEIDPDQEHGIYRGTTTFSGIAHPGDPREPIQRVIAWVDDGSTLPVKTARTTEGVRWAVRVNTSQLTNGQHTLVVGTIDDMGTRSRQGFTFYVDAPYTVDPGSLPGGVDVPRTEPSPFPFSLLDHYQAYQPFYNTVVLVLLVIVGGVWAYRRYKENQPAGTPEYVRPDEP